MATKTKGEEARAILAQPTVLPEAPLRDEDMLSWGITTVDLACYGRARGGLAKGFCYGLSGRSGAGKTFVGRTILAEAAANPAFDDYELVYDDVELGALMDTERFFGKRFVERLVAPTYRKTAAGPEPVYSVCISDFYGRLMAKLQKGQRLIWIEDSLDCLTPVKATKMGDGKAKINNANLRELLPLLAKTGSILVLVSQAHADLQSIFPRDVVSGGRALEFYPTVTVILKAVQSIKRVYNGKKYVVGQRVAARVNKNRLSGCNWTVYFPFRPDYGIDNIGACIDFLRTSGHWRAKKGEDGFEAKEFGFKGWGAELSKKIEDEDLEPELKVLTAKVWHEMARALRQERKPRYD